MALNFIGNGFFMNSKLEKHLLVLALIYSFAMLSRINKVWWRHVTGIIYIIFTHDILKSQ